MKKKNKNKNRRKEKVKEDNGHMEDRKQDEGK